MSVNLSLPKMTLEELPDVLSSRLGAIISSLLLVLILEAAPLDAAVDRTRGFSAVKAAVAPTLETPLSDPIWRNALICTDFEDLTTRRPAPLATTAYLLYDDQNLYVGFNVDQAGIRVVSTQTTDNVGFGVDDFVGIGIDPSGNGAQMYYFEVTPRGVRYQQSSESARYNPHWQSSAQSVIGGWHATMIIPLRDLRAKGGAGLTWRVNFVRGVAATGEHYTWAFDPLMEDGQPPQWPDFYSQRFWPSLVNVQLSSLSTRPQPRADLYALTSIGHDRNTYQQSTQVFTVQPTRHLGLDLSYPITNTAAIVGTIAPDFSNVEVDQQTIAPQEFRRALSEYRPFFAQGAQFFEPNTVTPVIESSNLLFYTPSIGTIDRGAKIEGTSGLQSFGLLNVAGPGIDDDAFGFERQLPDHSFVVYADGAFAHHFAGSDSSGEIGASGRNAHTDLVYGLNVGREEGTLVPDPAFAHATDAFIGVHQPNYEILGGYHEVGPFYNPIDGFTLLSDVRGPYYRLIVNGTTPAAKNWSIILLGDRYVDHSNAVRQADVFAFADVTFKDLVHLSLIQSTSELRTYASAFPRYLDGLTQPFDLTTVSLGYRDGTPSPVDLSYGEGPFSNFRLEQFTSSVSKEVGSHLSLTAEYDGTHEKFGTGSDNAQFLERLAVGESLSAETNFSIGLRDISGTGGFAQPGVNLAAAIHRHFDNGDDLYVNYGTPAAPFTLNRLIIKFVAHFGGGAGT